MHSALDLDALAERGFTTVGLLNRRDRRRLTRRWKALDVDPTENYYASSVHAPRSVARQIDQDLKAMVDPLLDGLTPGLTTFLAAFISKGSGGGDVELHPDWTYTDERRHRAIVFWCPLVDTDAETGTMHVLPRTHARLQGIRGSGDFPSPVAGLDDDLLADCLESVPLEAGEAIVWDAALVHGSGPNLGDRPRPAIALARAPTEASLVHFHKEGTGPLEGFTIDESYYTTDEFGTRPSAGQPIDAWADPVTALSPEDLVDF